MDFKLVKDFFDSQNKYKFFYSTVNTITVVLLMFVFVNQFYSFIDEKTIDTYMVLARKVESFYLGCLVAIILFGKIIDGIVDKANNDKTKIVFFTIKDLCDILARLLIIVELATMLIAPIDIINMIFYILVLLYCFFLLFKGLYHFNYDIFTFSDIAIPYFDCDYKRLHLDDYVIYQGSLYKIERRNDIYCICRDEDIIDYKEIIPLEDALKNVDGKLKFHHHGKK